MAKQLRTIYLDTVLWNQLCDEAHDGSQLHSKLRGKGLQIIISSHVVMELAKTFKSTKQGSLERGKQLFRWLEHFLVVRTPFLKQNHHLLQSEVDKVLSGSGLIEPYYGQDEYTALAKEVKKLSCGNFDEHADSFLSAKKKQVKNTRAAASSFAQGNKTEHADMPFDRFLRKVWARDARHILRIELKKQYPNDRDRHITFIAKKLLANSSIYRFSDALVRAHFYINWRISKGGSLPRDTLDDCFHLANASYSDIYATRESGQGTYASHVNRQTQIAIYDGSRNLGDWLVAL